MKGAIFGGIFAMLFTLTVALPLHAIHQQIPSETLVPLPEADASKLYDYIVRYNPYVKWRLWPGKDRLYKGVQPHGAFLTTYVNDDAYFSIKDKKGGMAAESIIVKENYTSEKKLAAITVIYKIQGYNPSAGDWFWAKYDPSGKILASGKVESCIKCHGTHEKNDFIMTEKLSK
jgi:hypothetical protein